MTQTASIILNPREVPSVPWFISESALPAWSAEHWRALTAQSMRSALQQANGVSGLWTHDATSERVLTPAAILLLLIATDSGFLVVMTTRASHLRHHPGQVSFVGGRLEPAETAIQGALREASEEINLNTSMLDVLGALPNYQTISGFLVTPVVAVMTESAWQAQTIQVDRDEVDQVFCVPLQKVFDRNLMRVHTFEYAGASRRFLSVTHTDKDDEFFIWGASMAILHNFDLILRAHWDRAVSGR